MDNQSLSHTKWKCQYHVVFIPKYRRKVMYGKLKKDVREIIQTLCGYKQVKITVGAVCIDCVHLCIELPPKYGVSRKAESSHAKPWLGTHRKFPSLYRPTMTWKVVERLWAKASHMRGERKRMSSDAVQ